MVSISSVIKCRDGEHLNRFRVILFEVVVTKKERKKEDENGTFCNCTLLRLTVFRVALGTDMSLTDHKGTQRGKLGA